MEGSGAQAVPFHFHPLCTEIQLSMSFFFFFLLFGFDPENIKGYLTFAEIIQICSLCTNAIVEGRG